MGVRRAIFPKPPYFKPIGYIFDRRNDLMKRKLQPAAILIILINRLDSCVREEKSESK